MAKARISLQAMTRLAAQPNVAVKISGLGNVTRKREVLLATIEAFGVDRCMFASNFPVDSLRATFDSIFSDFERFTRDLDQRALFHDNAVRIYRMAS